MTITPWPSRAQQHAVATRLIQLAELDPADARSACHQHRFVLARMLSAGQSVEYVATWMARKFGVGLTPAEVAIRDKVQDEVQYNQSRRRRRQSAL